MSTFLIRRLASALLISFGVASLVFLFIHLIPGDPIEVMLGDSAKPTDREALRHALHLDLPLTTQYIEYFKGLFQGDWGQSIHQKKAVLDLISERLPATLTLTISALFFALLIALPMGIIAAKYPNQWQDHSAMSFSLIAISMPNFWLGPVFILIFSVYLGWLPISGNDYPQSIILPAMTLGLSLSAILARMIRSSLLEVLNEDFIRTALAKGLSENQMLWKHALGNAWLPVITLLGLQLGALLGGAVITEAVFSWPGIGTLLIDAIGQRDYPIVQGCVLIISLTYVVVNTLTDILYAQIDPRIRLEAG